MICFVENPNLPKGKVKTVICGTDDSDILSYFFNSDIEVLRTTPNDDVDTAVANHADMAALHIGRNSIILDKRQIQLIKKLKNIGMTVFETENEIGGAYPNDVKLNFAVLGKYVIGNFKYADEKLVSLVSDKSLIDVRQGYSKCSVLVINENAVITDDESIHRKITQNGIDSLLIRKGDVSLHGHEYGFIGGASGKTAKDEVLFFGDIEKHRDFERIQDFLNKYGCNFVCTDKGPLRDIGGVIPLIEEKDKICK